MKDIYIYGEVVPSFVSGDGYVTLRSVQAQLKEAKGEDIRVRINCIGGDVAEGLAIYNELRRYAADFKAKVTTLAEGMCASIATVIFLAGDHRIMNEYTEPFVHNAWCYTEGDNKAVQKMADELGKVNKMIAKHYAAHTDLTEEQALLLMAEDTFISADECLKLRFAHEIEAVVKPLNSILKTNKMAKPTNKKLSLLQRFNKLVGISNKIEFDAENREVDFYELEDDDTIKVGDKAKVDGKPAAEAGDADGKITMASGEVFVFDGEELTEIIPVEEEEEGLSAEDAEEVLNLLAVAQNKIKTLQAKNKEQKETIAKFESLKAKFKGEPEHNPGKGNTDDKPSFGKSLEKLSNRKKQ